MMIYLLDDEFDDPSDYDDDWDDVYDPIFYDFDNIIEVDEHGNYY